MEPHGVVRKLVRMVTVLPENGMLGQRIRIVVDEFEQFNTPNPRVLKRLSIW